MKQLTKYNRVAGYLEKVFRLLNDEYFESSLSMPVITIQSTPNEYGHVSITDKWEVNGERKKELNIGAGTLERHIENVIATMIHEMVHLYCADKNIKDTSRNYTYHNKNFKEEAEKRGLIIEHHKTYGWTITSPSDEIIKFCIKNELEDIKINRIEFYIPPMTGTGTATGTETGKTGKPKAKSSTRKYKCPYCGQSIRATKEVNIICGDCMEKMELVKN